MPLRSSTPSSQTCSTCHSLDRSKVFYWKGGPSRHRMFKRYFQHSDYHSLRVSLNDLKFSSSRSCPFCVIVFDIFRWLSRTRGDGPRAIVQAKVEICIPFREGCPVVLTYSWLPAPNSTIPRVYDLQLSVPTPCERLPWSSLTVGQQIHADPKLSFFRAAAWLRNCLQTHNQDVCERSIDGLPNAMPTRLVAIGESQNQVRLIECGDKRFPYFALSYCWGPTQHSSTTKATYQNQIQHIPWSSLPKTYKDAIDFTRALGYRYIWIDSICIVQDDRNEWHHEASCMGEVYRNAVLTISATNANHVGFGCFTDRPGSRSFKNRLQQFPDDPTHVLVQEPNSHINLLSSPRPEEEWPIFRRAWTLQERLLATRIIHFTSGELVWECASAPSCECGHLERTKAVTSTVRFNKSSIGEMTAVQRSQAWDDLVLSYQQRSLTEEADRLSALSGLAQLFKTQELGDYVAGVWSKYALSTMLWEVKNGTKAAVYNAPSWSWASIQGRLLRDNPIESNENFAAEVLDMASQLASHDHFGAIRSAFITLNSPVADGTIAFEGKHKRAMIRFSDHVTAFFVHDADVSSRQHGSKVMCAFFRGFGTGPSGQYIEGLVLRLAHDLSAYERIGIAHVTKHSLQYVDGVGLELRTITII